MATDSLLEDMEPRHMQQTSSNRQPHVPFMLEGINQAQVSEPSLFDNEISHPRLGVHSQASPLKTPNFIPKLPSPLSCKIEASRQHSSKKQLCDCLKPMWHENLNSSSKDTDLKKLIQDQNTQLKVLQHQVQQLLQYQEKLQDKSEDKNMVHESTQTSILLNQLPKNSPMARIPTKFNLKSIPISQPQEHMTEFTLTFRDLQLETILEQPPSPQESFTVAMHEYQESISENLNDNTEALNVIDHVQKLLTQANIASNKKFFSEKFKDRIQHAAHQANLVENPVRKVTMQRVQELGVSFIAPNVVVTNVTQKSSSDLIWDSRKETDQSVEMERLVEKYLGHSSTKQLSWQPQSNYGSRSTGRLEMSISSQQYLERYGLGSQNY